MQSCQDIYTKVNGRLQHPQGLGLVSARKKKKPLAVIHDLVSLVEKYAGID